MSKKIENIFNELKNDKNVFWRNDNNNPQIGVISYNKVLCENKRYVKSVFKKICKCKELILKELNSDHFSITISDYNIDGLYESNNLLISENSQINCNF